MGIIAPLASCQKKLIILHHIRTVKRTTYFDTDNVGVANRGIVCLLEICADCGAFPIPIESERACSSLRQLLYYLGMTTIDTGTSVCSDS